MKSYLCKDDSIAFNKRHFVTYTILTKLPCNRINTKCGVKHITLNVSEVCDDRRLVLLLLFFFFHCLLWCCAVGGAEGVSDGSCIVPLLWSVWDSGFSLVTASSAAAELSRPLPPPTHYLYPYTHLHSLFPPFFPPSFLYAFCIFTHSPPC